MKLVKLLESEVDPSAVARRNIEPDGSIWLNGKIVPPSDEVVSEAIQSARKNQEANKTYLQKLESLKASKRPFDREWMGRNLPADSSFHSIEDAICRFKNSISQSEQYIKDISEANRRFNKRREARRPLT